MDDDLGARGRSPIDRLRPRRRVGAAELVGRRDLIQVGQWACESARVIASIPNAKERSAQNVLDMPDL